VKVGWKLQRLGDLCAFDKSQGIHTNLPYVGLEHIDSGTGQYLGNLEPTDVKSSTFKFNDSHVLYGRLRPYLNKVLLPDFEGHCSTEIFPIQIKPGLLREYLGHWLMSESVVESINATCTGARMPRADMNEVLEFNIPVPSEQLQRRIVTLLDEAFADIAAAKANAEKNLQNAEALFQSQLTTLFNRRAKNANHTTLGQATGGIFTGPFGSLLHKQDYVENGIPLVNPAHISQNGIEPDHRKTVSGETAKRLANYIMRTGDIVIGRRGEMGRCALVTDAEDGWLCGTGSFFIKPSSRCDAGYLVHLLRSDQCKQQLENIAGGAVMPNLSNTDLSNFALELPPVEDQKQIVAQIEEAKESVERLKSIYRQKLTALDDLKKSLLHQAFSGQL
jgi:type I restriction enzyme S subunit